MSEIRIRPDSRVMRTVQLEILADLYRRLEFEKNRRGSSFNAVLRELLLPRLEQFPQDHKPEWIES